MQGRGADGGLDGNGNMMARCSEPENGQRGGRMLGVILVVACLVPCAAPLGLAGIGAIGLAHLRGSLTWVVAAMAVLTLLLLGLWRVQAGRRVRP